MKYLSLTQIVERVGLRQKAYKAVFGPPGTAMHDAFVDLARYCHAFDNAPPNDPIKHERLAGRREAFFHIWEYLNLTSSDLVSIYPKIKLGEDHV